MVSQQAFHPKAFSIEKDLNRSPKNILQDNGLQNKPFTKKNIQENSLTTKQAVHQKTFSKKTVYKTSLSPKNILQENGLQNKPFTKKRS